MPRSAYFVLSPFFQLGVVSGLLGLAGVARAGDLEFRTHLLDGSVEFMAAAAMDVNKDGKLDIICGSSWYEAPNWTKHHTRDVEVLGGRPDGYSHLPIDVNGDNWQDLIIVNWRSRSLQWVEHPGAGLGEWKVHQIEQPGNMESGRLVDMDGDGQLDVLPSGSSFAAWWSFQRVPSTAGMEVKWTRHPLPQEVVGHGIGFGDINSDGRVDVIGPTGWAEAPENRRADRWVFHEEFFLGGAPVPVMAHDVDKDGDNDLLTTRAHDFGIYWFENTGNSRERTWVKHVIDTSWSGAHAPLWGDLDKDGNMELIVGKRYRAHEGRDPGEYDPQYGYRYEFDPKTRTWHRWLLTYNEGVGFGLDPKIADLDADGDDDLLLGGRHGLYWLENLGRPHAAGVPLADDPRIAPIYQDTDELLAFKNREGQLVPVKDAFDWGQRRAHIFARFQQQVLTMRGTEDRVPLAPVEFSTTTEGDVASRELRIQVDREKQRSLMIHMPRTRASRLPGVVMMRGDAQQARALASKGMICIQWNPIVTSYGEVVWEAIRACDLLESLPESDGTGIGLLGMPDCGDVALLAAAADQRIRAVVLFDALAGSKFRLRDGIAAIAPRPVLVYSRDFDKAGSQLLVQAAVSDAAAVYRLRESPQNLKLQMVQQGLTPAEIEQAAQWFNEHLRASPLGGARGRGGRGRGPAAE